MSTSTTTIAPASADLPLQRKHNAANANASATFTEPDPSESTQRNTPAPLPPITSAEKRELIECDTRVRAALTNIRLSRCEIAYFGHRLRKSGRWTELGFTDEAAYRESLGISPYTWNVCLLVGRLLEPLSLAELTEINIDRGRILSYVHPDIWFDYDWLYEAKRIPESDLRELVKARNRTLSGGEQSEALTCIDTPAVSRLALSRLKRKYNLSSTDAVLLALRDADTTITLQLASAIKHANKLLTLADQSIPHYGNRSRPQGLKELRRLMAKAKARMQDALACAVAVQSKR